MYKQNESDFHQPSSEVIIKNATILCLHAVEVRNTIPAVDLIYPSSVFNLSPPCPILLQCLSCLCLKLRSSFNLRPLRSCLKSQTNQAFSQVLDCLGSISNSRSCFDVKPRFAALQSVIKLIQEWDTYRKSNGSRILVIRSVTYKISYIELIYWWNFCSTFWQVIESERRLLAHELCHKYSYLWNLTSDLNPSTCNFWLNLWLDFWPLT